MRLVAILILFVSVSSLAQDNPQRAQAKQHYEAGEKAFRLGEFERAVKEFKASYDLSAVPLLLYNVAQAYRQMHDLKQALFFYQQYLAAGAEGDSRGEAQKRVEELKAAIEQQKTSPDPAVETRRPSSVVNQVTGSPTTNGVTASAFKRDKSLYKRPWLWVVVGGGVAIVATGVVLGVVLGGPNKYPTPSMGVAGASGL